MTLLKILTIFFILFASSRVLLRYRNKEISIGGVIFWILVWTATFIAVVFPEIAGGLAHVVGVGRGVDSAFFVAILLLFYLTFRIYIKLDKIDRDLADLTIQVSKKFHTESRKDQEK